MVATAIFSAKQNLVCRKLDLYKEKLGNTKYRRPQTFTMQKLSFLLSSFYMSCLSVCLSIAAHLTQVTLNINFVINSAVQELIRNLISGGWMILPKAK